MSTITTVISPSSGAGVLFTQQGVGTTPGYSALDLRRSDSGGTQEGVFGFGASAQDFMVQQRIAGANMQVEVTMPAGGMAAVQGDSISGQGLYDIPVHSANALETIGTADPSNPRVDQVILEVQDNVLDASGGNLARTRVLPGTATSGANLTNRTGAAVLPGSALLLADVLVGAGVGSITNTVIRDRRKWARGAYGRILRTAGDYTTASTTFIQTDSTNLNPRFECSGIPLRARLVGVASNNTDGQGSIFQFRVDGAVVDGGAQSRSIMSGTVTGPGGVLAEWDILPAAGSHLISPYWETSGAGTSTLLGNSSIPLIFVVEEIIRQNAANNTVTTG